MNRPRVTTPAPEPNAPAATAGRPRPSPPVPARRALFGAAASGLLGLVSSCAPSNPSTKIVQTSEGKVLQWERDDLLVLVSGLQERYRPGERIQLTILLNNQTSNLGVYRPRTKLSGRGQQVLVETPVESVQVKPFDAASIERVLPLEANLERGEYTLTIELPPWTLDGRSTGGGSLGASIDVEP